MVEKWMRGSKMNFSRRPKAHYGKPIQLFKDSDRDGVANVFDCKPYNKRRQDVISPFQSATPVQDMLNRQESSRQQREYQKRLAELQKLEEQRLEELRRIQSTPVYLRPVYTDKTINIYKTYKSDGTLDTDSTGTVTTDKYGQGVSVQKTSPTVGVPQVPKPQVVNISYAKEPTWLQKTAKNIMKEIFTRTPKFIYPNRGSGR